MINLTLKTCQAGFNCYSMHHQKYHEELRGQIEKEKEIIADNRAPLKS